MVDAKDSEFDKLMQIYETARQDLVNQLFLIKNEISNLYGYDVINSITSRIKTPQSIINKMNKKRITPNYKNMVDQIDDIAGIRITCPFKDDIKTIKNLIAAMDNVKIIQEKDYIKRPKESGYSAYHLIVENKIKVNTKELFVKVEIQIRTMSMDFWATTEHKMRYKTSKKLSIIDSKKLSWYAKIINMLDNKMSKIYRKQTENGTILY